MSEPSKTGNPHFIRVEDWEQATRHVGFDPGQPADTLGNKLITLSIFVMDHKKREVKKSQRELSAYYDRFVFTQAQKSEAQARRWAQEIRFGPTYRNAAVNGHQARVFDLGPEVPPDDIDGRSPAIVVWHENRMFYMVASHELDADLLVRVANSIHPVPKKEK